MNRQQMAFVVFRALARRNWAMRLMDRIVKPFNPFSPLRYTDPYPLYERLHEAGPVFEDRLFGTWMISGYAECREVLGTQHASVDRASFFESIGPYSKVRRETLDLFTNTLLMLDPPGHTRLRRIVNRAFTPRAIAGLEPSIEKITRDLLHDLGGGSTQPDVQTQFADRLPVFVICDMLGLPRGEWDRFKAVSDQLVRFIDSITSFDPAAMDGAVAEFSDIVENLVIERRRQPRYDILSRLIAAEDEGDRLDHQELLSMVGLLMVAGHETTSGLLGNALVALHRTPAAKEQLMNEPDLIDNAVDELLRYDSPVQMTDRITTGPINVSGRDIPADSLVSIMLGAANRDPRRFDRPNELILNRRQPRPLSFGYGIHHCLGAVLARLEAKVALPLFLRDFPGYKVDEERLEWKRSLTLRGPRHLPVALAG